MVFLTTLAHTASGPIILGVVSGQIVDHVLFGSWTRVVWRVGEWRRAGGFTRQPENSKRAHWRVKAATLSPKKKNTDLLVLLCLPALFLTFGKVNGAKIDRFFLGRRGGS